MSVSSLQLCILSVFIFNSLNLQNQDYSANVSYDIKRRVFVSSVADYSHACFRNSVHSW